MGILSSFSLYAMPNHLRPSTSYKGLVKGNLETPRNFTDRIYLTDIVDTFFSVLNKRINDVNFKILWHRGYFPWRIRIRIPQGSILLTGKVYGESTWNSAVTMQFKNMDPASNGELTLALEGFVKKLGRPPYDSPYWTEETWQQFTKAHKTARRRVEESWAEYLSVLNTND